MNPALKKFIIFSLVACIVLIAAAIPLSYILHKHLDITPVYYVVPFIMAITIIFHYYLLQASKGESKKFISKFMASSGIKLMIYLTVIVLFVLSYPKNITVFLVSFLISYFVFTFIEVVFILSHLKK